MGHIREFIYLYIYIYFFFFFHISENWIRLLLLISQQYLDINISWYFLWYLMIYIWLFYQVDIYIYIFDKLSKFSLYFFIYNIVYFIVYFCGISHIFCICINILWNLWVVIRVHVSDSCRVNSCVSDYMSQH